MAYFRSRSILVLKIIPTFRSYHSTEMALIKIQDMITKAIDNKKHSLGIFIDLAKAFDTVDHSILIKKKNNYGVRGVPLE